MAEVDGDTIELPNVATDNAIAEFSSYEDYLDSQITPLDLYYLEDQDLARQLVELGYRGTGDPIKRDDFENRKRAAEQIRQSKRQAAKTLASAGKDLSHSPFLQALADREEANRSGRISTIIFLRCKNAKNQEISGYLDYSYRLKTENFDTYFSGARLLLPKPSDLSFYNWDTQLCTSNPTPHFQVLADNESGLLFKNKRNRKIISVDPLVKPGDSTTRMSIKSPEYIQVAFYDHVTRKKV